MDRKLLETCITVWHWPVHQRWYDEGIRKSLDMVKKAGFSHVNWNPDSGSSYWMSDAEIQFTANMVREAGLKVHSIHGSNGRNPVHELKSSFVRETRKDILSSIEWQRISGVELVKNRIDLAAATNSPNIVMHIDITDEVFLTEESEEKFFHPLFKSLDELCPYCLNQKVQIAVETLFCASADSFLKLYERLFDRYESNFIGLCYDSGHWEIVSPGDLSVLDRFGDRLIATHIHDNFGARDNHLLPFDGRLNWNAIIEAISKTPYQTPLNFETPYDRYQLSEMAYYERAYKVCVILEQMLAKIRS